MFWSATHRKILAILEIDRDVNEPNKKKPKNASPKGQKIGLSEALKKF